MIKPLFLGVAVFLFVQKGAKKGYTIYWYFNLGKLVEIPYEKNLLFNFILL